MTDEALIPLATPTRFLMENGEWNLTPSFNEMNPFEYQFTKPKDISPVLQSSPSPPLSLISQSPTSSNDSYSLNDFNNNNTIQQQQQQQQPAVQFIQPPTLKQKKSSNSSGRKRRIVFEGEDAEERRKKFLERNRIAAYKCRQRKKSWMQELEQKAEFQNTQNEELRALVARLKEESMYLRNLLLTHGNCDCESVQAYIRKTSLEISNNTPPLTMRSSSLSTGLTPYLTKPSTIPEEEDYFSTTHQKP